MCVVRACACMRVRVHAMPLLDWVLLPNIEEIQTAEQLFQYFFMLIIEDRKRILQPWFT